MVALNPFRPSTGASPPEVIGRASLLEAIGDSLDEGPGAPARVSLFTGQRGVGKTVMLNESSDVALQRGWHHIDLTATPGLLTRLESEIARLAEREFPGPRRRLTGVQVAPAGGVSFEPVADHAPDLRARLTSLLDDLGPERGLMVTVDEVHGGVRSELRELGALTQHMVREERQFALVMAGLPAAVTSLLSDEVLTFLRRADRHQLEALDIEEVQDALEKTIGENGRRIEPGLTGLAAKASGGYPYLVQLVGYHIWRNARSDTIGRTAVERGIHDARSRLGTLVHEAALNDLSDVDRRFLVAMSEDDRKTRVADLARRLSRDRHYINTYRRRLIAAQVIEEAGRGYVRFAIPYLGDYLREEYADES